MAEYHTFSQEAVSGALDAARANFDDDAVAAATSGGELTRAGEMSVLAECVSVTVDNGKVCVDLPLGIGKHCISIPVKFPGGTVGQACLSICTTWKIPTGVKVSVIIGGITVVSQSFGKC